MSKKVQGKIRITKRLIGSDLSEVIIDETSVWNVCTEQMDSIIYGADKNNTKLMTKYTGVSPFTFGTTIGLSSELVSDGRKEISSIPINWLGTQELFNRQKVYAPEPNPGVRMTYRFQGFTGSATIRTICLVAIPSTNLPKIVLAYKSLPSEINVDANVILDVEYQIYFPTNYNGSWVPPFAEANFPSIWAGDTTASPTVSLSSSKTAPNTLQYLGAVTNEAPAAFNIADFWPVTVKTTRQVVSTLQSYGQVFRGLYYNLRGVPLFHDPVYKTGDSLISNVFAKNATDYSPFSERNTPPAGWISTRSDANNYNFDNFPSLYRVTITGTGAEPSTAPTYQYSKRPMFGFGANNYSERAMNLQYSASATPNGFFKYCTNNSLLPVHDITNGSLVRLSDRYALMLSHNGFTVHDITKNDVYFANVYTTNTTNYDTEVTDKQIPTLDYTYPGNYPFEIVGHTYQVGDKVVLKKGVLGVFPSANVTLAENTEYTIIAISGNRIRLRIGSSTDITLTNNLGSGDMEIHRVPNFIQATEMIDSNDTPYTKRFFIADNSRVGGLFEVSVDHGANGISDFRFTKVTASHFPTDAPCYGVFIEGTTMYAATSNGIAQAAGLSGSWDCNINGNWSTGPLATLNTNISAQISGWANFNTLKVRTVGGNKYVAYLSKATNETTKLRMGHVGSGVVAVTAANVCNGTVDNYDFTNLYLIGQNFNTTTGKSIITRWLLDPLFGTAAQTSSSTTIDGGLKNLVIITNPSDSTNSYVLSGQAQYFDIHNATSSVALTPVVCNAQGIWAGNNRKIVQMQHGVFFDAVATGTAVGGLFNPNINSPTHDIFEPFMWKKYGWDGAAWVENDPGSRAGANAWHTLDNGIQVKFDFSISIGIPPNEVANTRNTFINGMYHNIFVCDGIIKDDLTGATFEMAIYPNTAEYVTSLNDGTNNNVTTVPKIASKIFDYEPVGSRVAVNSVTGTGYGIASLFAGTVDISDIPAPAYLYSNILQPAQIGSKISSITNNVVTFEDVGNPVRHHFKVGDEVFVHAMAGSVAPTFTISDTVLKVGAISNTTIELVSTATGNPVNVTSIGSGNDRYVCGVKQTVSFKPLAPSFVIKLQEHSLKKTASFGRVGDKFKVQMYSGSTPGSSAQTTRSFGALSDYTIFVHRITLQTTATVNLPGNTTKQYLPNSFVVEIHDAVNDETIYVNSGANAAVPATGTNITAPEWTPILENGIGVYDQRLKLPMFLNPVLDLGDVGYTSANFRCVEDYTNDSSTPYGYNSPSTIKLTSVPHYMEFTGSPNKVADFDRRNSLGSGEFLQKTPTTSNPTYYAPIANYTVGVASGSGKLIFSTADAEATLESSTIAILTLKK